MARLGEYDTRVTTDGKHLDVYIEKVEIHADFSVRWAINDIGMVYLLLDVNFNGKVSLLQNVINFNLVYLL